MMPYGHEVRPSQERRAKPRKRALIVGDDILSRIELRLLLEMHGFQVDEVSDGMEAIGMLDVDAPRMDLVVLDYEMPLLSGMDTFHSLRAMQPGLRALLCLDRLPANLSLPEGVAFLKTPCTVGALREALAKVMGGPSHAGEHMKKAHSHWITFTGHLPHYPGR